ncbi:uncharacterized protein LOC133142024 isoform X1 [Conger conger]|uniref:uncharacterized protein LOC133142024 isoform X1 n=2 Tax=Conger conger TaxID=82655 RepID=UPI002A59EDB4|nr:uncharacterized protein LOC133142024 isoform X1 [Conger conger]
MAPRPSLLLLLIVVLLDRKPTPDIYVQSSSRGMHYIACYTTLENPTSANISCDLYIGDSRRPYSSAWTTGIVCMFTNVRGLRKSSTVSCAYRVNQEPQSPRSDRATIVGQPPKAELQLSAEVISIEGSVTLRCRGPDSSPASNCYVYTDSFPIEIPDCELTVSAVELLRGKHGVLNEIAVRCLYSLNGRQSLLSLASAVTVLDVRKPDVSTEQDETRVHCKAPAGTTGAYFLLYSSATDTPLRATRAGGEERAVTFSVPYRPGPSQAYCCRYRTLSKWSDCVGAEAQRETATNPNRLLWRHILSALVLLAAIGFLIEHFLSHRPITDSPGRRRRGSENTAQFVETVC